MSCLLTSAINNDSKLPQYLQECQKYNIKVLPPAINDTEIAFKLKQSENALIYSLQAVKQMSYNSCRLLLANRNEQGRFLNFWDFCARMVAINLVRKSIEYLIAAGALDEFNYNRITLLANLDNGLKYGNIVQVKTKSSQNYNFKFPTPAIINYPDN